VTTSPTADADAPAVPPRWGLGDVAIGLFGGFFVQAIIASVVISAEGYANESQIPLWIELVLDVPLWAFLIGVPLYASYRKGNGPVRDLGLRLRAVDVPIGIAAGLAGQLLLIPALYWPVTQLLGHSIDVSSQARSITDKAHGSAGTDLLFLLVVVGAPLAEEIFFRGFVQRALLKLKTDAANTACRLVAKANPWAAILLADLVWTLVHGEPVQSLGLFAFGVVLGVLAWRTGRLGPSLCAHVTFNAVATAALLWKL
jgi:membrane protease YdiL (CAAX protease family)